MGSRYSRARQESTRKVRSHPAPAYQTYQAMGDVAAGQFDCLVLNGKNYQTWVVDCRFHLAAMQLTHTITLRAEAAPADSHNRSM
uniref:Uncharacterized protein n=1 Tax=Setaria viridis TaxID=4556 RepID=A0A4U6U6A9_SETVI|nr:hypothetical protein SEVIR_6G212000v2 [Setaria viridis]